jgi:hypothetical protein
MLTRRLACLYMGSRIGHKDPLPPLTWSAFQISSDLPGAVVGQVFGAGGGGGHRLPAPRRRWQCSRLERLCIKAKAICT